MRKKCLPSCNKTFVLNVDEIIYGLNHYRVLNQGFILICAPSSNILCIASLVLACENNSGNGDTCCPKSATSEREQRRWSLLIVWRLCRNVYDSWQEHTWYILTDSTFRPFPSTVLQTWLTGETLESAGEAEPEPSVGENCRLILPLRIKCYSPES